MILRSLQAGACLCVIVCAPVSAQTPEEWLLQASEAARSQNYQGVVIYSGNELLDTFRVAHRLEHGEERERMQSLNGEVREVLKHDDQVICILPRDQKITSSQPTPKGFIPQLPASRLAQLGKLYTFEDLGRARIAGRQCQGIAVYPKDEYRYGYEVWADAETSVPLKVRLLDADRRRIEEIVFSQVEFPQTIPDAAFESAFEPETMRQVTQSSAPAISAAAAEIAKSASDRPADQPQNNEALLNLQSAPGGASLPPGFRVAMRDVRTLPDARGVLEHILLSDGLTSVSIFRVEQRVSGTPTYSGVTQLGAVNAYSRVVGRMSITVVGEAPQRTIRMIGDSFRNGQENLNATPAAQPDAGGVLEADAPRP